MAYAGFDISTYPGDGAMDVLREQTNLVWCGFYLGPTLSHPDASWMDRHARLRETAWGLAPIYVGQLESALGARVVTKAQGNTDGEIACSLAKVAGFPNHSVLYLDIEPGGPLSAAFAEYFCAWIGAVQTSHYAPGVRCSQTTAKSVRLLSSSARIWVCENTTSSVAGSKSPPFSDDEPSASGVTDAVAWQWIRNGLIAAEGQSLEVNLDTAATGDISVAELPGAGAVDELRSPKRGAFPTPSAELARAKPYIPEPANDPTGDKRRPR